MSEQRFQVKTASGVSAIEAGFGLVHADTIVATTDDEISISPPAVLTVNGKQTSRAIKELGLGPGSYDASIDGKRMRLLLVDPSRCVRKFGARCGALEYDLPVVTGKGTQASWDSLWKTGEFPDVVVDFDAPYKFVFWRGMSYAPSWAMGNIMTSLFFAETVEPTVFRDCCEMMSDRECRYSHVRVVHNSSARVVIHWRCALADPAYTICRNQWADELFYIYPDGVAVRNVTIHLDPKDQAVWKIDPDTGKRLPCSMLESPPGKRTFNDMEFISVNPAGATSDDVTPLEALTLMDTRDFSKTFVWPKPESLQQGKALPKLNDYIFRMNYRNRPAVFVASLPEGLQAHLQENTGMRFEAGALVQEDRWVVVKDLPSNFADHIHWPVTRGYGTSPLTDPATFHERPTHTFLGYANNAPIDVTERGDATWVWFCGMAPDDDSQLRARVRSWSKPAKIQGASYQTRQGAYLVNDGTGHACMRVDAGEPVVRPSFLLNNHRDVPVSVLIDGRPAGPAEVAVGVEQSLSSAQTVVTFNRNLVPGTTVEFRKESV